MTTTTTGPQPLPEAPAPARATWLILAAAAAFVAATQFSGGSGEARECTREAHDNARVAKVMGGEARYVDMCMELQRKVREANLRK